MSNTVVRPEVVDREVFFSAFDELPVEVRSALAKANFNYDPRVILQNWRDNRRGRTPAQFAADMVQFLTSKEREGSVG